MNSEWFRDSGIILFLNKQDLFEQKIKTVDMKCLFPKYTGSFFFLFSSIIIIIIIIIIITKKKIFYYCN